MIQKVDKKRTRTRLGHEGHVSTCVAKGDRAFPCREIRRREVEEYSK